MSYFQLEIDPKEHFVARAISRARDELRKAFLEMKSTDGLTQAEIARRLGVDRAVINRQLTGEANLTVRSLAELAWVLERDLTIQMSKPTLAVGANEPTMVPAVVTQTSSGTVKAPPQVSVS